MTETTNSKSMRTRRDVLLTGAAVSAVFAIPSIALSQTQLDLQGTDQMSTFTTTDGTEIFYKDWGPKDAQPIFFHHGWPLSSDDWDNQMLFFASKGYRVIAHDRRGHGRSSQTDIGHDMDTYAADVAELTKHLDLRNAVHVGHSTGEGEAARYVSCAETRAGCQGCVARGYPAADAADGYQSRRHSNGGF